MKRGARDAGARRSLDALFGEAVALVDAGDVPALERLLATRPELARERLEVPGPWLREKVGSALDGFFARPYLLWFVAEDPVRNGRLPANIGDVTRAIVAAARRERAASFREQVDYALRLVSYSWIARDAGVQLELVDTLVDAGASLDGHADQALVNGNSDAARRLLERGAPPTLASSLCLDRWEDADRLAPRATEAEKQLALVLAALNGRAESVSRAIDMGADPNAPSAELYSHGTPLHHAAASGSLAAVQALVAAGADVRARDRAWGATPLGWAEHALAQRSGRGSRESYAEIAAWLKSARVAR